jgi:hypothetical protein
MDATTSAGIAATWCPARTAGRRGRRDRVGQLLLVGKLMRSHIARGQLQRLLKANTDLTQQVHDLTQKVHLLTEQLCRTSGIELTAVGAEGAPQPDPAT